MFINYSVFDKKMSYFIGNKEIEYEKDIVA